MAIPNRLAVSGEELVIHRFESGEVAGLASPCDLRKREECRRVQSHGFWQKFKEFFDPPSGPAIPAVCIPPGARLLVRDIPANMRRECGIQKDIEEAVFTQITAAENTYRDAVRFRNGFEVLLQRFVEGQRVRVLSLSAAEEQGSGRMEQHGVSMRVA
jgi:hypothetical protein